MKNLFIEYPKCSTCQKAKKWLEANNVEFVDRHIIEKNPTEQELEKWIKQSGKEIKSWFNTSGLKYKELKLKEKLSNITATFDAKRNELINKEKEELAQKDLRAQQKEEDLNRLYQ